MRISFLSFGVMAFVVGGCNASQDLAGNVDGGVPPDTGRAVADSGTASDAALHDGRADAPRGEAGRPSGDAKAGGSDATPPDDAGAPADATADVPAADAPVTTEAGAPTDGGAITCGSEACYAGETCVDGGCQLGGCNGVNVPGDYATVQAAVDTLRTGTICLGAQTYDESVTLSEGAFTLQGVDRRRTTLNAISGQATFVSGTMSVTLIGLTLGSGNIVSGVLDNEVYDVTVTAKNAAINGLALSAAGGSLSLILDGVDLGPTLDSTPDSIAVSFPSYAIGTSPQPVTLSITNSYFHGSSADTTGLFLGAAAGEDSGNNWNVSVTLENDTFDGVGVLDSFSQAHTLTVTNTLFVNAALALSSQATTTDNYDGFYNNTTNFAGSVVPGSHLVTANPLLDTNTPPGLLPGSPARGAGDPTGAPNHDFYGHPRGAVVDLGAVQSSP